MSSKVLSAALVGAEAIPVEVEAQLSASLPNFVIVGLPDTAVSEARERVRAALGSAGLPFPQRRVTVNLAPADVRKEGSGFDLAVAVAVAAAAGYCKLAVEDTLFLGELGLDGQVRPVPGAIAVALLARHLNYKQLFVPKDIASEAALVSGVDCLPVGTLSELLAHLRGVTRLRPAAAPTTAPPAAADQIDFAMVRGQAHVKRALVVAAAGGHNLLLSGPPGVGKTLLARSLVSILPPLTHDEVLEVTGIYSVAGLLPQPARLAVARPFRQPHHTASPVSLVGGGTVPRPGEISLAHRGVLFLDELPLFPRAVLEALRQPLEEGRVTVSRAQGTVTFPARFVLVGAKNPCPCGYLGAANQACRCTPSQRLSYRHRLSGPLLDRIDLHVAVSPVGYAELGGQGNDPPSASVVPGVVRARAIQASRYGTSLLTNSGLGPNDIATWCPLQPDARSILEQAAEKLHLSPRAFHRLIKVSRTIADLAGCETIETDHVAEALQYREPEETW